MLDSQTTGCRSVATDKSSPRMCLLGLHSIFPYCLMKLVIMEKHKCITVERTG